MIHTCAMRVLAALLLLTATAVADPTPTAKPAEPLTKCKRVGKGAERKILCEVQAPIIVKAKPPKPAVAVVARDGRAVTGRPKSEDRLQGLSPFTK
jgi:hypothetical protein